MTEFFSYEILTWPEVAGLPRAMPLILPLGQGYPFEPLVAERLADALADFDLGHPERVGILPAFPYGWVGSGLPVPESILEALIANLLNSLRDDGFARVYALTPQGPPQGTLPGLGASRIVMPLAGSPDPFWLLPLDENRSKVVLIPVGHTEQHAYHLPLSTDTLIIEAIAQGIAQAIPEQAIVLPIMPYGVSTHRASFAGTLNAGGRAFEDFYLSVMDVLVGRGYERAYLLSGHGGNCSFLTNVVKYAGERYPHTFIATAWLYLSGPQGIAALQAHRLSGNGGMGHACELETSFLLHLRPDLVHMDRVVDETYFIATPSYYMDWVEGGALVANPPWTDDTATGAYGAGSLATAEHGALWLQAAITEKIAHVAEIHEQYTRRRNKRLLLRGN